MQIKRQKKLFNFNHPHFQLLPIKNSSKKGEYSIFDSQSLHLESKQPSDEESYEKVQVLHRESRTASDEESYSGIILDLIRNSEQLLVKV